MSSEERIQLKGFEESLADDVVDRFTYSGDEQFQLATGRNVFVNDLPPEDDLREEHENYKRDGEPTLVFYTEGGPGILPSISLGGKHEWSLQVVVRFRTVFEDAKSKLEEVIEFLKKLPGRRVGAFRVNGSDLTARPTPFQRGGDMHAFATATVRIQGVALPE